MMMELLRVHGAGDMRLDHVPVPEIGPHDVLLRVIHAGVCGTDLGFVANGGLGGGLPLSEPLPLGHEFAGVVHAIGSAVRDIPVGMRCAVNPDADLIGCGGPDGAFAPYIVIRNAAIGSHLCPISEDVSLERVTLAEPLSVALHGINIANPSKDANILVLGAGPIGLCAVIALRLRGISNIAVADLSDARLARAKALGAAHVFNPARMGLQEGLAQCHGGGERFGVPYVDTDCFLDAAGSGPALRDVVALAKYRAKIVVIALHKKPLELDLFKMMANEVQISGSIAANRVEEFKECVEYLSDRSLNIEPLISHRYPFADIEAAFDMAADVDASAKVMIHFDDAA
jgi:threonine dehydrogenase-like Zn-dependent dehydrogenase